MLDFADGRVRLVGMRALKGGAAGRPAAARAARRTSRTSRRASPRSIATAAASCPRATPSIEDGDEVFFIAAREDIRVVMSEMRKLEEPVRRVVIAGGGNIGLRLAQALEERTPGQAHRARSAARAAHLRAAAQHDRAERRRGRRGAAARGEHRQRRRVRRASRTAEEANILSAMLAKRLGCAQGDGADQPARLRGADGERHDRRRDLAADSHDRLAARACAPRRRRARAFAAARRRRGDGSVAHGSRASRASSAGASRRFTLPDGATIGAIVRGDEVIMAHHDTMIERDDHVILFLSDRRQSTGRAAVRGRRALI